MAEKQTIKFNYGSEQLIKDAGSISMMTALGVKSKVENVDSTLDGVAANDINITSRRVPGVCRIDYEFIPGISKDGASAINAASKKLYTFVRHLNSGSRNYDSPDLMMYCYSVISTQIFIASAERAYGLCRKYSAKNRYLAKRLVDALGYDYDSIIMNLSDFRAAINVAIAKLNALKVPSDWQVWTREWYLNLAVFKDGDVDKSQLYFYRMRHMWKYNETGTYVGSLTPVDLYATQITLPVFQTLVNNNIDALVASEDINIMSGDILKAYDKACIENPYLPEEFTIEPIYDRNILEMIHNTNAYALNFSFTANSGFIIRQNTSGDILFEPALVTNTIKADDPNNAGEYIQVTGDTDYLDFYRDDISAYDIINAASLKVLHDFDQSGNPILIDAGTELATAVYYVSINESGSAVFTDTVHRFDLSVMDKSQAASDQFLTLNNESMKNLGISKFDWSPMHVTMCAYGGAITYASVVFRNYDLYNFAEISRNDLSKMHQLHVLAGFNLAD